MRSASILALATILASTVYCAAAAVAAKIAAQTKANLVVDREALDDPDQIFSPRRRRLCTIACLTAKLLSPADAFHDALWRPAVA